MCVRVAKWFIFQPKIPICINFDWNNVDVGILWPLGIFDGHLGYSLTIRYILCLFGTFFRIWYHAPRKIRQP
jgi:hypothetical protein